MHLRQLNRSNSFNSGHHICQKRIITECCRIFLRLEVIFSPGARTALSHAGPRAPCVSSVPSHNRQTLHSFRKQELTTPQPEANSQENIPNWSHDMRQSSPEFYEFVRQIKLATIDLYSHLSCKPARPWSRFANRRHSAAVGASAGKVWSSSKRIGSVYVCLCSGHKCL